MAAFMRRLYAHSRHSSLKSHSSPSRRCTCPFFRWTHGGSEQSLAPVFGEQTGIQVHLCRRMGGRESWGLSCTIAAAGPQASGLGLWSSEGTLNGGAVRAKGAGKSRVGWCGGRVLVHQEGAPEKVGPAPAPPTAREALKHQLRPSPTWG